MPGRELAGGERLYSCLRPARRRSCPAPSTPARPSCAQSAAMPGSATGAERLLAAAVDCGLEVCFANPGTSEMHFVSALDTVGGMRAILGLHETVCTGAADGYARMARKPALALLHLGPGLANGLCNAHNARRASTPMVLLIGDMATWHKGADPLLNMDIPALAGTVSKAVVQCQAGTDVGAAMRAACQATAVADAPGGSRIATVIAPHDLSWERSGGAAGSEAAAVAAPGVGVAPGAVQFAKDCAVALRSCRRGKAALYVGGKAGLADGQALEHAGRIAAATGAALFCENAFARVDRGAGLPALQRLPYFPQDAAAALSQFEVLVLVDVRRPVAQFGYEGGPSQLVTQPDSQVWELDSADADIPALLALLSDELGGAAVEPLKTCGGMFAPPARPALPQGKLTPKTMCHTVAALQPANCIIVDEVLTSGQSYWDASLGCPPFSHLTLTGGAIGCGPPLAVGAAVACPDRVVINLQADGSGMYSAQALWTQAREGLHVVTVVAANRTYAILKVEMAKQRITPSNGPAAKALTEIGEPAIDWVQLAQGLGVAASRATTCEELAEQLAAALERPGPSLIEACLP